MNKYIPTEGPDDVFDHLSRVFARGSQWQCALDTGLVIASDGLDVRGSRQMRLALQIGDNADIDIQVHRYCGESRGVRYTVTAKGMVNAGQVQNVEPTVFYDPGALDVSERVLSVTKDLQRTLMSQAPNF